MVRELERRRDVVVAGLDRVEGVSCRTPDGAFYALPDITGVLGRRAEGRVLSSSVDLCEWLIDEHGLALLPGEPFGAPGHLRWSFAASMDELQRGLSRFREAIASLG
jgi:aspartate aminotransferase